MESIVGLWDLAVLCSLYERPMHPYDIQTQLTLRHKAELLALKKGSLYHAIQRLAGSGSIVAKEVSRQGNRPERTVYEITEAGKAEMFGTLRQLIARPRPEPSEFMASVSFLVYLSVDDAKIQLRKRLEALDREVATLTQTYIDATPYAGRVNLLELDYASSMRRAEAEWIRATLNEIEDGQLTWDIEEILHPVSK